MPVKSETTRAVQFQVQAQKPARENESAMQEGPCGNVGAASTRSEATFPTESKGPETRVGSAMGVGRGSPTTRTSGADAGEEGGGSTRDGEPQAKEDCAPPPTHPAAEARWWEEGGIGKRPEAKDCSEEGVPLGVINGTWGGSDRTAPASRPSAGDEGKEGDGIAKGVGEPLTK
jgi:hypothetical protein